MSRDPRLTAFCSPQGPDIFHSVTHHHEIWKEDPYDVEIIHRQARECLKRLLDRVITPPGPDSGRILLLLGKSGAGKTHLMRAFRNQVHARHRGYFSYMQMTTSVDNYARYILSNTLDSLDKPYHEPAVTSSGLMRLSNALVENDRGVPPRALRILREEKLTPELLNNLIYRLADRIASLDDFSGIDLDLIRVLLYLQRDAPVGLKARVLQYLRCENLTDYDRRLLGGLTPRLHGDDPQRLLASLGRLIWAVDRGALVVCLDQLEDMYDGLETSAQRFRQAMKTVVSLADQVPTLIVAISCLEDFYTQLRQSLTLSLLDRIEHDPEPVRLGVKRTADEVEQLIAARLMVLYDDLGVAFDFSQPLYPFPRSVVRKGVEMPRVRDILDWCRRQREHSIRTGLPPGDEAMTPADEIQDWPPETGAASANVIIGLEQAWNDFRVQISSLPEGDAGLCALLAWAIRSCSSEMVRGHHFVAQEESDAVAVDVYTHDNRLVERLLICLCNQSSLGGSLARRIQAVEEQAGDRIPVLVRCSPFPGSPKTKVAQQLGRLLARGGRRIVIEDSDWRAMWAMQSFRQFHANHPGFQDWLKVERPLSRLPSLRTLLELERLGSDTSRPDSPAAASAPPPGSSQPAAREPGNVDALVLGRLSGSTDRTLTLSFQDLLRHAVFLGEPAGSQTVLARSLVEQLVLGKIPTLVVDGSGLFEPYARPEAFGGDPAKTGAETQLREHLDAVLYTLGAREGRSLGLPLLPLEWDRLSSRERERLANESASAMGDLLGYPTRGGARIRLSILAAAIQVLGEHRSQTPLTLEPLIELIASVDPVLLTVTGQQDGKHYRTLARDLQTLQLRWDPLFFAGQGELLDVESLLGQGQEQPAARTRLSLIDTRFLGDRVTRRFWMAHFLMAIGRYVAHHKADGLRAAVVLTQADDYLPGAETTVAKTLVEDLCRQAQAAGIALLLETHNPAEMDSTLLGDRLGICFAGRMEPHSLAYENLKTVVDSAGIDGEFDPASLGKDELYRITGGTIVAFRVNKPLLSNQATRQTRDRLFPGVPSL